MRKIKDHQINQSEFEWKRERKSHNKMVSFANNTHCDQNYSEVLPKIGHTLRVNFLDLDMSFVEVLL
jgi:translation initiation factor 2 alpha subunit (eIF-2alpha)